MLRWCHTRELTGLCVAYYLLLMQLTQVAEDLQPSPPISSPGESEDGESCGQEADSVNPREEMRKDPFARPKESASVFEINSSLPPPAAPGGPAALTRPF
jgi:hypothetical protein